MAPFWRGPMATWWCRIYYATSSSHPISGRIAEGVFSMELTRYLQPQPRSLRYFKPRTILTAHNKMVDELNSALLPSSLGWPTPLQAMTGLYMRHRTGMTLCWECWYSLHSWIPADTDTNGVPKGKPAFKWDAQWCCVQPTSFPYPLQLNKTTDHFPLHTCPWGLQFGRYVNLMESKWALLASPYEWPYLNSCMQSIPSSPCLCMTICQACRGWFVWPCLHT